MNTTLDLSSNNFFCDYRCIYRSIYFSSLTSCMSSFIRIILIQGGGTWSQLMLVVNRYLELEMWRWRCQWCLSIGLQLGKALRKIVEITLPQSNTANTGNTPSLLVEVEAFIYFRSRWCRWCGQISRDRFVWYNELGWRCQCWYKAHFYHLSCK